MAATCNDPQPVPTSWSVRACRLRSVSTVNPNSDVSGSMQVYLLSHIQHRRRGLPSLMENVTDCFKAAQASARPFHVSPNPTPLSATATRAVISRPGGACPAEEEVMFTQKQRIRCGIGYGRYRSSHRARPPSSLGTSHPAEDRDRGRRRRKMETGGPGEKMGQRGGRQRRHRPAWGRRGRCERARDAFAPRVANGRRRTTTAPRRRGDGRRRS